MTRAKQNSKVDRSPFSSPETKSITHLPLAVEYWPLAKLLPYARNARTHSDAQVAEIAGSIRAFGFANPILIAADGGVIAGHGRLLAARQLGMETAPVIVLGHLTDTQRRQLVLADNRIAANAGWDLEMLRLELTDLRDLAVDLKTLGFEPKELASVLSGAPSAGLTGEDDVPDIAEDVVSRIGDVWFLGSHRLACGDSTDAALVAKLLEGAPSPKLMVTDPPYGVEYDPGWRHEMGVSHSKRRGKVLNDERADWGDAWKLFPGDIVYVWHGALHAATVANSLVENGFAIRAQIIWAKTRLVIGRGDYHWQHEPAWYAVRKKGFWTGGRKQTTLWSIASKDQDAETVHGTQKPVECMRRPMTNHTGPGEAVYEPFMGSGTTLIAAETIDRVCLGLELSPAYVDLAVRRWQAFTGRQARLGHDGPTFQDIAATRGCAGAADQPGGDAGVAAVHDEAACFPEPDESNEVVPDSPDTVPGDPAPAQGAA